MTHNIYPHAQTCTRTLELCLWQRCGSLQGLVVAERSEFSLITRGSRTFTSSLDITDFNLIYFFTDFNLIEISRLLDGSITTDVEVYYNVPWYLIFLKANIDAYLKQSIQDRLRITYQALREG